MRVAIFTQEFPAPSETFVIRHVISLLEAGVDVTVMTAMAGEAWNNIAEPARTQVRARTRLIEADLLVGWRQALRALPSTGLLRQMLARKLGMRKPGVEPTLGRYDVILAHFGNVGVHAMQLRDAGHVGGRIATIFHAYEISVRTMIAAYLPHYRRLFRRTEALLPISRRWAGQLEAWGADPKKIRVLHMGADLPETPVDFDRASHRPLRVVQVGRLVEKKGARYSIEAVGQCSSPIVLDLIGSGPMAEELQEMANSLPGPNQVRLRGSASHDEVLAALDEADVFLLPSVTAENGDVEGIPVALMEAMLHGCVVVSTIHSGIPELIEDGVSGLLVPERSAAAIARALDSIAQGNHDLAAMRRSAVEHVVREFNNARLDQDLVEILERVARGDPLRD